MATAKQKAKQRDTVKAKGGRQISALLKPDESALLDRLKTAYPDMNQKEILVLAMKRLDGLNEIDWPNEMRRFIDRLEQDD